VVSKPSFADYLLFRRSVAAGYQVELVYHGEYGGAANQKMPGEPNIVFQCDDRFEVSLFSTQRTLHRCFQKGIPDQGPPRLTEDEIELQQYVNFLVSVREHHY